MPGITTQQFAALERRLEEVLRAKHYSRRTLKTYRAWGYRFVRFHRYQDPARLGGPHVEAFLTALAVKRNVSASTQNQALSAILFFYKHVLRIELPWMNDVVRAKRSMRIPVVLSRDEVRKVLGRMTGTPRLVAELLYGAGLRLDEGLELRIKDLDFERRQTLVQEAKGRKARETLLPAKLVPRLKDHLRAVHRQYRRDLVDGAGYVELPYALARKYPKASVSWPWQWVFPATRRYVEERTGECRRHHLHESVIQRAVRDAVRASGITKHARSHTFRHYAGCRIMPGSRSRPA